MKGAIIKQHWDSRWYIAMPGKDQEHPTSTSLYLWPDLVWRGNAMRKKNNSKDDKNGGAYYTTEDEAKAVLAKVK